MESKRIRRRHSQQPSAPRPSVHGGHALVFTLIRRICATVMRVRRNRNNYNAIERHYNVVPIERSVTASSRFVVDRVGASALSMSDLHGKLLQLTYSCKEYNNSQ